MQLCYLTKHYEIFYYHLNSKPKLNNPIFRNFMEKHMKRQIKDESHYRKNIIPTMYNSYLKRKIDYYVDKSIYLIFDETTDANGRKILNIF